MTVTLEYDKTALNDPWSLVMECVEDIVTTALKVPAVEKDADYWFHTMNHLGAIPMRTLFKDTARFFMALYAAGYIHVNGLTFNAEADKRNPGPSVANPDHNPFEPNVAQEGRGWGLKVEAPVAPSGPATEKARESTAAELLEQTKLSNRPKLVETVREQVEQKEKSDLEKFLGSQTTMGQLEAIRNTAGDSYVQKWAIAERLARKPREAWQNAPWELVKMVEYCVGWIKDTGEVPEYPRDLIDIWWKRPTASVINMSPEAVVRRDAIVTKVRSFWTNSVEKNRDKVNVRTESYRATLAAMELERLIEKFANGEENELDIRKAATKYFHAHFPIETFGVKPGPISTLDPDFTGYMKLCQKYNLEVGTLLHEAQL